jgi:hypothetical protein
LVAPEARAAGEEAMAVFVREVVTEAKPLSAEFGYREPR